jgi:hypothetical protein
MSKTLLKDAPGGERLISRLRDQAADLALFFVGEPDDKVRAHLNQTRANLERDLADTLGAKVAGQIAEGFCAAVMGRKREIERSASAGDVIEIKAVQLFRKEKGKKR